MKLEHITEVLSIAGIVYSLGNKNRYIQIQCPYAPYSRFHKKGFDRNASGYIKVSDDGVSFTGCFTCDNSHTFVKMLLDMQEKSQDAKYTAALTKAYEYENKYDKEKFHNIVNQTVDMSTPTKLKSVLDSLNYPMVNLYSYMHDTVNDSQFIKTKQAIISYLKSRKYSDNEAQLLYDNFPFFNSGKDGIYVLHDFLGHKIGYMEFKIINSPKPKYVAYFESSKFMINEICLQNQKYKGIPALFVCEGLFDVTRLWLKYKYTVGTQGKIKEHQMDKILYFTDKVFYFTDMDKTGYENVKKLSEYIVANVNKFGNVMLKVFDKFKTGDEDTKGDDPDSFFTYNDIYNFNFKEKGVFINYVDFLKKYKDLFGKEEEKNNEDNKN